MRKMMSGTRVASSRVKKAAKPSELKMTLANAPPNHDVRAVKKSYEANRTRLRLVAAGRVQSNK